MKLKDKIALVTGGSRGIGRAIVKRFALEGALVAVHYGSNRAAADETVEAVKAGGGDAFALQADIGVVSSIEAMFRELDAQLMQRTGSARFDILVNNAGISPRMTLEETTLAQFNEVFAVNVQGPFFTVQHAAARLRDGGRIINVSSMSSQRARPLMPAYSASKGALDAMTMSFAKLLGPRGITVNGIAPGAVDTDLNAPLMHGGDPKWAAYFASRSIFGRVGQPEDLAGVAAFLASDDACWVTGDTILASGGQEL
jgi:3-oxoacyl-[acyl-carrier protein] reductase